MRLIFQRERRTDGSYFEDYIDEVGGIHETKAYVRCDMLKKW